MKAWITKAPAPGYEFDITDDWSNAGLFKDLVEVELDQELYDLIKRAQKIFYAMADLLEELYKIGAVSHRRDEVEN